MKKHEFRATTRGNCEATEQILLFQWATLNTGRLPDLALMYHVPNGGTRNEIEAARLKQQGVKPGVPDICIPAARGRFHGMYIEMKANRGRVSDKQKEWLSMLNDRGYHAVVCYGFEDARLEIEAYFSVKTN